MIRKFIFKHAFLFGIVIAVFGLFGLPYLLGLFFKSIPSLLMIACVFIALYGMGLEAFGVFGPFRDSDDDKVDNKLDTNKGLRKLLSKKLLTITELLKLK